MLSFSLALAVVSAACTTTSGAERSGESITSPRSPGTTTVGGVDGRRAGKIGKFVALCPFSHRSPDDPIVRPGLDGRTAAGAHSHDFYGNTTTDAYSTPASLLATPTTCNLGEDRSSYWTPTLYRGGEPVTAEQVAAYYDTAPGIDPATVSGLPAGLMVVAGNGPSAGVPPARPVGWTCGRVGDLQASPPSCGFRAPLTLQIAFPDCWDGRNLDSPNHRQHLAYSTDGRCPDAQPVPIIRLLLWIRYPVYGDPGDLAFSSGPVETAHADFMNAWTDQGMADFMSLCIRRRVICGEAL